MNRYTYKAKLKFGDVLLNHYAGEGNPIKKTIYLNSYYRSHNQCNPGRTAKTLDMKGDIHEYGLDNHSGHLGYEWLEIIGNIFDDYSILINLKNEYYDLANKFDKENE